MKKIKLTNLKVFRLLALLLCLAATVPQMRAYYTPTGDDAYMWGTTWNVNTSNNMAQYSDPSYSNYYYLVKTATVGSFSNDAWYQFQVVENGNNWYNTGYWYGYPANNSGTYTCVFTFDASNHSYWVTGPYQSLTVAGSHTEALGTSWDPSNSSNDMTSSDGGVTYTLTKNNVPCSTGQYDCKVASNHNWDSNDVNKSYPSSGNVNYSITEAGNYDIVYTFNTLTQNLTIQVTPAVVISTDYYVVGDETLIGQSWTISNDTKMAENQSTGNYTWSKSGIHLNAGSYKLKVTDSNGNWYGDANNPDDYNNVVVTASASGTYTLEVIFDPNTEVVTATLTPTALDPTYTYNIYVRYKGSEDLANVHLHAWDANGDKTSWPGLAFANMQSTVINGHTYYTISYTGYASTMGILFNENGSVQTADQSLQPGDSYFTYWGGDSVVGPSNQADPAIAYYVVGDDTSIFPNEWGFGNGTVMTDEDEDGIYSWTSAQVHLVPGTYYEYKVRDNEDGWYPENAGNQTFNVYVPGTYTVTVTYDSNTGTVTATTTLVAPDPISTVYVVGNANTQQWAANAGIAMEYDDETGYYSLKNVVLTAMSHFAFATVLGNNSEDWTTLNANRLSSNGDSHWAINDGWLNQWMSTQNYVNDNHNWYVEQSGAYDIDFNPSTREVRVKRSHSNLYISYGVNWTYENNSLEMTTVDGNIYQATITLTEGDYFLFSTGLSDETAIGATTGGYEISNLMIGFAQRLESGINNFHFTGSTGKYIVVVNIEKNTVTLRKTADVTVTKIFLQKTSNVTLDPAGGTYQGQTLEGKRGGIYAWNKLNTEMMGGTYQISQDGPTNYTYEGEVMIDGQSYGGNNYLKDLPDTTTADGKQWYAWSVSNSICEFYFIRNNQTDLKSQKIMRRAGEVWLIWVDKDATYNRQDNAVECDSLQDVTSLYYDVTASGVSDCSTMLEDHYYVYYTNTTGWDSVYCYAWYGKGGQFIEFNGPYPGAKCTFVGYDEDGYEVWCYDFGLMEDFHRIYGKDENDEYIIPTNVIFDNGKGGSNTGAEGDTEREQTGDLPFDNGACYDYLGMVYLGNSLNGIINTGIVNGPKYTVEDNLVGVYYDENALTRIYETDLSGNPLLDDQGNPKFIDVTGALYAKDFENYSAKSKMPEGTTDYVYDICAHVPNETYPGGSQIQIKRDSYDQSNWVKIVLSPNFDNVHLQNTDVTYDRDKFDEEDFESATDVNRPTPYLEQYVGKIIPGGSMSGNLVNSVNPQMHITNIAKPLAMEKAYEPNVYVTGHFNDTVVFSYVHQDWNPDFYEGVYRTVPHMATDENNQTYVDYVTVDYSHLYKMFYVAPKPQEIAYITWAVFDHDIKALGTNAYQGGEPSDPGAFYAPMNWNRIGELWDGTGLDPEDPDAIDPNAPWGTTYGPYSNGYMQYGAFQVNWSLFEGMEIPASDPNRPQKPWYQIFKPGQAYKILAVIRYAYGATPDEVEYSAGVYQGSEYNDGDTGHDHVCNAPRRANDTWDDMQHVPYNNLDQSKFIIFPLRGSDADSNGDGLGNVTTVKEVTTARTVVAVRYYNLMGVESDMPFDGLNIIVTTYSDGYRTSKKILR